MRNPIYRPKGRALEYGSWALNLFRGCSGRCRYCYAPAVLRMSREEFHNNPQPREGLIEALEKQLMKPEVHEDKSPVFLCFTCDPFQPDSPTDRYIPCWHTTTMAVALLHSHYIPVRVLTKQAGPAVVSHVQAWADFWEDHGRAPQDEIGVTLTVWDDDLRQHWEPGGAPAADRVGLLQEASGRHFKTWVSLEPILDVDQALRIIELAHPWTDRWMIGKENHGHVKWSDDQWREAALRIHQALQHYECEFKFKEDLVGYLGDLSHTRRKDRTCSLAD